mgnify:FL=1
MPNYERTLELIQQAKSGDQEALQTLTIENSPLIKSIIKRYIGKGIEYDDLFQLGSMGFIKAVKNFDTNFNVRFSTYVVPMIIGEIKRFMRDDGTIKVSRSIKSTNIQINRYVESFVKENGDKPTIEQIAKHFELDAQEVVFIMDSARMPISLYTPFEDGENKSLLLIDRYVQDNSGDEMFENIALKEALKNLEERDKMIILMRYFRDKTQSEIAKELKISQVQVSRLEMKILNKMREKLS